MASGATAAPAASTAATDECAQCGTLKIDTQDNFCHHCGVQHAGSPRRRRASTGNAPAGAAAVCRPPVAGTPVSPARRGQRGGKGRPIVGTPQVVFQGWLKKRGKRNRRSWRVRWFVLYDGGLLVYYTGKDRKKKKGAITMEEASVHRVHPPEDSQDKSPKRQEHGFNILTGSRLWEIFAGEEENREKWVTMLEKFAVSKSDTLMDEAEAMMEAHLTSMADEKISPLFSPWRDEAESGQSAEAGAAGGDGDTSGHPAAEIGRRSGRDGGGGGSGGGEELPAHTAPDGVFSMNFAVSDSDSNSEGESSGDEVLPVAGWVSERGGQFKAQAQPQRTRSVSTPPAPPVGGARHRSGSGVPDSAQGGQRSHGPHKGRRGYSRGGVSPGRRAPPATKGAWPGEVPREDVLDNVY